MRTATGLPGGNLLEILQNEKIAASYSAIPSEEIEGTSCNTKAQSIEENRKKNTGVAWNTVCLKTILSIMSVSF